MILWPIRACVLFELFYNTKLPCSIHSLTCSIFNPILSLWFKPFMPYITYPYRLSSPLYISSGTDMDHFLTIKRFLMLVIIFFILMTSMFDLGEILKGDSGCWSLLEVKLSVDENLL